MIAEIAAGITSIKNALAVAQTLRDQAKLGPVAPDIVTERLLLIHDHMLDLRQALLDAAEREQKLIEKIATYDQSKEIQADLDWEPDGGYYFRKSERAAGKMIPYCPICWHAASNTIPMANHKYPGVFKCGLHEPLYTTKVFEEWQNKQDAARRRNIGRFAPGGSYT